MDGLNPLLTSADKGNDFLCKPSYPLTKVFKLTWLAFLSLYYIFTVSSNQVNIYFYYILYSIPITMHAMIIWRDDYLFAAAVWCRHRTAEDAGCWSPSKTRKPRQVHDDYVIVFYIGRFINDLSSLYRVCLSERHDRLALRSQIIIAEGRGVGIGRHAMQRCNCCCMMMMTTIKLWALAPVHRSPVNARNESMHATWVESLNASGGNL